MQVPNQHFAGNWAQEDELARAVEAISYTRSGPDVPHGGKRLNLYRYASLHPFGVREGTGRTRWCHTLP